MAAQYRDKLHSVSLIAALAITYLVVDRVIQWVTAYFDLDGPDIENLAMFTQIPALGLMWLLHSYLCDHWIDKGLPTPRP